MDIGAVIVKSTLGWRNTKGLMLEMSNAENVPMKHKESSDGIPTQNFWAMLSEHTLERCKNCGMWIHDPLPCTTCILYDVREKWVA